MTNNKKWTFENLKRWKITAILETLTPLHIGNGEILADIESTLSESEKQDNANAFIKDGHGKPIIPGSSIKGKLRNFLESQNNCNNKDFIDKNLLSQLLGEKSDSDKQGGGGIAEFHDAYLTDQRDNHQKKAYQQKASSYPDWNADSNTYLEASTAINRHTLTARDGSLHYQECVPPGTQFKVVISGDMTDKHVELLLSTLNALANQKIALGAEDSNGKGLMEKIYSLNVEYLDHKAIKEWLDKGNSTHQMAQKCMRKLDDDVVKGMQRKYQFSSSDEQEIFDISLNFSTPFIVNDPAKTSNQSDPDLRALRDAQGNPILPAKSFRGAIRSQAERIIRTMGADCCDTDKPCQDSDQRCLVCDIFGSTGWKSTLKISDFTYVSEGQSQATTETQQFVAIDRFHGGGKDTALYDTEYFPSPTLKGMLALSLRKGNNSKTEYSWRKGLLALLFRDLKESDISFGLGKNKGYGKLSEVIIQSRTGEEINANDVKAFRDKVDSDSNYSCDDVQSPDAVDKSQLPNINPTAAQNNHFHNPYHFIPLHKPNTYSWAEVDRPHKMAIKSTSHHSHAFYRSQTKNGEPLYHGRITCTLTTETPLFIGSCDESQDGQQTAKLKENYRVNNQLAIPATSLRGMISSLIEAASNSAMRELDTETILSYRKKVEPMKLGFIIENKGELKLLPTGYLGEGDSVLLKDAYTSDALTQFIEESNSWSSKHDQIYYLDKNHKKYDSKASKYFTTRPPTKEKDDDFIKGVLRILGKTGSRVDEMPNKKHECFIPIPRGVDNLSEYLHQQSSRGITIDSNVIRKFNLLADQRIKSQKAKRERRELTIENALPFMPKGDTRSLDGKVRLRHGDIVYYKQEGTVISEVSFSAIWRDKLKDGIKSFIPSELHPFNPKRNKISPVELLFGFIEKEIENKADTLKNALAFAGKVSISAGLLGNESKNKTEAELLGNEVMLKELSSPKPPSPALYFKRKEGENGYTEKSELQSQQHQIQGRKIYLHALKQNDTIQKLTSKGIKGNSNQAKLPWETQHPEDTAAQKRKVRIRPIQTHTSFNFNVEFNNLTEWELGLLCYGLRPDEDFRHKLGMGKPIGLGTIKIDINELELIDRNKRYIADGLEEKRYNTQANLSIDKLKETFINTMQADIFQALKLIGNPDNVKYPVHYPQVTDHDIEEKSYQWFVANDTGSGQGHNKTDPKQKNLQTLKEDTSSIPTLQRYKWNG